jgi:drug/metabolite transporter (DMT)-like permease
MPGCLLPHWPLLYGGLLSVGVGYTLQTVAQSKAKPSHAAVLLSLEGAFAVLGGLLLLNETLQPQGMDWLRVDACRHVDFTMGHIPPLSRIRPG